MSSDGSANGGENSAPEPKVLTFTQEQFNTTLAEHKRTMQRELGELKTKQQAHDALRSQVEELLGGRPFEEIADELRTTNEKLMSQDQLLAQKEQQHTNKLKEAQTEAEKFKTQYQAFAIERSLTEAAATKSASKAATRLIVQALKDQAAVGDNHTVTIEMEVEEDGVRVKKALSPDAAVASLEADPDYAPLFKSTASGGTGKPGSEQLNKSSNGTIDVAGLTMEQYADLRAKNPSMIGL
jgi:hypothetical protein